MDVGWKVTSVDFASQQVSLARPLVLFVQRGQGLTFPPKTATRKMLEIW
jgi:hypothetical protein